MHVKVNYVKSVLILKLFLFLLYRIHKIKVQSFSVVMHFFYRFCILPIRILNDCWLCTQLFYIYCMQVQYHQIEVIFCNAIFKKTCKNHVRTTANINDHGKYESTTKRLFEIPNGSWELLIFKYIFEFITAVLNFYEPICNLNFVCSSIIVCCCSAMFYFLFL